MPGFSYFGCCRPIFELLQRIISKMAVTAFKTHKKIRTLLRSGFFIGDRKNYCFTIRSMVLEPEEV
ncbi:MAG: hypothetical protein K0S33_996 [Bacteroidetes bacterium]|jgi:hypothetical protein|nr:hypothetical protein [Bacteroidota bacterium]